MFRRRFWTGKDWTDTESETRLYATVNDAGRAIQEILLTQHGHKRLVRRGLSSITFANSCVEHLDAGLSRMVADVHELALMDVLTGEEALAVLREA